MNLVDFIQHEALAGYAGWMVIEQDRAPVDETGIAEALVDQHHNARWLADVWEGVSRNQ